MFSIRLGKNGSNDSEILFGSYDYDLIRDKMGTPDAKESEIDN
jgi:hypothetical protein